MSFITWDESYETHVNEIDEQHKTLVSILNKLHEAMHQGKGKEILGNVFTELLNYTVYHFQTEEGFMKKLHFPDSVNHIKEHKKLTDTALTLNEKFNAGEAMITSEVLMFLKNWLTNHILVSDKKLGAYLLSNKEKQLV